MARYMKTKPQADRTVLALRITIALLILIILLGFYLLGLATYKFWFPPPIPDARLSEIDGMPLYTDFITEGSAARPGGARQIKYLVLHETDNFAAGATAEAHNAYIHKVENASPESLVSWHYTVDNREIYHHVPDDEPAFHAGDGMKENGGNLCGIGIEMCVNEDGDYEQTLINAERLCARLLLEYNLKPDDLRRHKDFSGKECPGKLLAADRWGEFCEAVKVRYEQLKQTAKQQKTEQA